MSEVATSGDTSWYFEDFTKGTTITTAARTVTETDIVMIVGITGHCQPLFTDEVFARQTPYGTRIAPIELTIGVLAGLLTRRGILENQIGLLEYHLKAPDAVKAGDTLRAETEVVETRPTSKGDRGVVTFDDRLMNQDGTLVLEARRVAMFQCRPQ